MDEQVKAKWIEALRSGDYRQGMSMLHDPSEDSYCCLGVLCKVLGAEFGEFITEPDEHSYYGNTYEHVPVLDGRSLANQDAEELSKSFCGEIGIPDQGKLIEMNDGVGSPGVPGSYQRPHTFSEIADYIEKNL